MCRSGKATPEQLQKCKDAANLTYEAAAVAAAAAARQNVLNHLLVISLVALALAAMLSAWLGWIAAGRALRPVLMITAAARRASEENLSERIALKGPADELKDLADTFDAMLARLEAAFASQRRFVANASHELRTPLTVMRTAIDVTLGKPERSPAQLEAMAAEVRMSAERAETLIEALLTLARSDRGTGARALLDLAVFAEDALDAATPTMRARSLRVRPDLEPATATGDPVLVERLVMNLIDNAVRHNVPDGWIAVSTGNRDGKARISVANSGPIIAAEDAAMIFEPFRRLYPQSGQESPEGVGLGLSIVASVVTAHGGRVAARPLPDGGLEVTVELPALGLDVLRHLAQEGRDLLGLLGVRVLAAPVDVREPIEELDQVFHDGDQLVGLLAVALGDVGRDAWRCFQESHLQRLGSLPALDDAELDSLPHLELGRP
jgi:signal transduction histidine kinase